MATMSRGQFAVMLAEWLELPLGETGGGFSDTNGTYLDAVVTALKSAGIVLGNPDGTFDAFRPVTRAEAAVMVTRAFQIPGVSTTGFADVVADSFYAGSVGALEELGIVSGFNDGLFKPQDYLTEAHWGIIQNNLTVAGYGPGMVSSSTTPDEQDDEEFVTGTDGTDNVVDQQEEEEGAEEVDPITEDFKQQAKTMLAALGIDVNDPEVDQFINDMWTNDWTDVDIDLQFASGEWEFFNTRFPAMAARKEAGFSRITAAQYVEWENDFVESMRRAGFPPGFYDDPEIFHTWIGQDRSPTEIQEDIVNQFDRIHDAEPEVLEWFTSIFGINDGVAGLAAFFLDPTKAAELLEEAATMGVLGGTGARYGFNIDEERARRMAEVGIGLDQARQGFGDLVAMSALFEETIAERGEDFEEEDEGLDAVFELEGGEAAQQLEQRRRARLARFQGGSDIAADQTGVFGLGTAT